MRQINKMATKLQEILGDSFIKATSNKKDNFEEITFDEWHKRFEPKGVLKIRKEGEAEKRGGKRKSQIGNR